MNVEYYFYRVRWSAEDNEYVGTVAELPSLSWLDSDPAEAFAGIRRLVSEVVEDMIAQDETPPEAIADRTYSGKFMVRVTPETHRQLAMIWPGFSSDRFVRYRLSSGNGSVTA